MKLSLTMETGPPDVRDMLDETVCPTSGGPVFIDGYPITGSGLTKIFLKCMLCLSVF